MEALGVWLQFFSLATVIGGAGYLLCRHADRIAEATGLGRSWIGLVLLATVTSLPELVAGITAVRGADRPDLAVGDVLGSCVFNLSLVFVLDLLHRESIVYGRVARGQLLSAALGAILISFAGYGISVSKHFVHLAVGPIGVFTLVIPLLYLVGMRMLYLFDSRTEGGGNEARPGLRRSIALVAITSLVIIAAGSSLPIVGGRIMSLMGWNEAFVGTLFIALATSVPEIAVTLSAIRLRAADLAFGNLLGSNLFNVVILTIDDAFYLRGPLFAAVSPAHAVTAFSAVMMTGLVMVALIQPPQRRVLNTVSALSLLILGIYALNAVIVYRLGG